jgi:hypothetical protein
MTRRKETTMNLQIAAVDSHIDDLRRLSAELHAEREAAAAKPSRRGGLRHGLGLRLLAFGATLIGDLDTGSPAAARR